MSMKAASQESIALLAEVRADSPQISMINQYLADGADINHQITDGYTPLMFAVVKEDESLVEFLLTHGANPLAVNHHNETASALASRQSSIYKLLKNYELSLSTLKNDIQGVQSALACGADINFQDKGGFTPILIAVEQGYFGMVELLLARGADIRLKNDQSRDVFDLVTEDSVWELLRRERPLPLSNETRTTCQIEAEQREAARLRTIAVRGGKPFDVSQLKIHPFGGHFASTPSQKHLKDLEKHFGHSLPKYLKKIFNHYNGGRPLLQYYGEDEDYSISHFYQVDDNIADFGNIWDAIERYSAYLGSETMPFAEDSYGGIYYLKWVNNKAQVWLFQYGGDLVFEDEDDGQDNLPFAFYHLSDSLEEFLEAFYEAD